MRARWGAICLVAWLGCSWPRLVAASPTSPGLHLSFPAVVVNPGHNLHSAADLFDAYAAPRVSRALTRGERVEIAEFVARAARYDEVHFGQSFAVKRNTRMFDLVERAYPGVAELSVEMTLLSDVAYVVKHDMTPEQVVRWRSERARANESEYYDYQPGFRFPEAAWADPLYYNKHACLAMYLQTYPVADPHARLAPPAKRQLFVFLEQAVRLAGKTGQSASMPASCRLMRLVASNYSGAEPAMSGAGDVELSAVIRAIKVREQQDRHDRAVRRLAAAAGLLLVAAAVVVICLLRGKAGIGRRRPAAMA